MNHAEFSSRGGKARAKKLTASARKRIASNAAKTRWKKKRSARLSNDQAQRIGADAQK